MSLIRLYKHTVDRVISLDSMTDTCYERMVLRSLAHVLMTSTTKNVQKPDNL